MKNKSHRNTTQPHCMFLILGLLCIGAPSILNYITKINIDIIDFCKGLGIPFLVVSMFFFSRKRFTDLKK
ncbi:hypothetical protein [uncultured Psychroserpens sp.]|uniref:hypothetical protein n=1 Tax=uncultured Psychroserpens sp. TaxID=255436 RepID=UPI00260B3E7F|nr:hypothetical protein [uncultured Psychroserpens sp.]